MEIRFANFEDYPAIAALHADNWRKTYRGILSDHYLDSEVGEERLQTWMHRFREPAKNQRVIVAMQDHHVIGFSCVLLNDDPVFGSLIDNLHVAVTLHKSGLGKALMRHSAQIIIESGDKSKMYLWVYEQNINARGFYDRMHGKHFETVIKENESGNKVPVCRYTWEDVSRIIDLK